MAKMQNPSSFFSGGGQIAGDVELEGRLDLNQIVIGLGAAAINGATAVGLNAQATGNLHSAAFGKDAEATGGDATALGTEAKATNRWNTVIGYDAGSQNNGRNIVLVGREATALGDNGIAIGESAAADGDNSTAVGRGTQALGDDSSVFGQASEATGVNSTIVGQGVTVGAANAASVGTGVTITGDRAVGVGANAIASGDDTLAFGESAEASGEGATAVGRNTIASGADSLAVGSGASASADDAVAIGQGTTVSQSSAFGIGPRDFELGDTNKLTFPVGVQNQTLVDKTQDGTISQGSPVGYTFEIDGNVVAQASAESDGAGGIQNLSFDIPVDFNVDGETTQVDNFVTGDFKLEDTQNNELIRFDATVSPNRIEFGSNVNLRGNSLVNIGGTASASGGAARFAHGQEQRFRDSGDSSDIRAIAVGAETDDDVEVGTLGNYNTIQLGTPSGGNVEVKPTLDVGEDIQDGSDVIYDSANSHIEQSILENSSLAYIAGDGLGGGGNVALGESATFNVGAGSFITANSSDIEVNIGAGIEGDNADNIRVRGDSVADGFLSEGTNPHQLSVNISRGLEDDGANNIRVDENVAFDFSNQIAFSSGLDTAGDIVDDTSVIYDSAAGHIEQSILENSSLTYNSGDGLVGGGNVSLGSSATFNIGAGSFMTANASDIEVNIGDGIEGDGSDNLRVSGDAIAGGFLSEGANPHQVSVNLGLGLEDDGSNNLRVSGDSIAGNVLSEGSSPHQIDLNIGDGVTQSGSQLIADSATFISVGSSGISVNIGTGLVGDGSDNIQIDQSTAFDFSSEIQFSGGLDTRGDIVDSGTTIYDNGLGVINNDVIPDPLQLSQINVNNIADSGAGKIDFKILGVKRAELDTSGNVDIDGELTEGAAL